MQRFYLILFLSFFFFSHCKAQNNHSIQEIFESFAKEYETFKIPSLALSYVSNLENIGTLADLEQQEKLFRKYQDLLKAIDESNLSKQEKLDLKHLQYEIALNLERVALSKKFIDKNGEKKISDTGLYSIPLGKEWYQYFLKKWLSVSQSPEEFMAFGMQEIEKVKAEITAIQKELGFENKPEDFYKKLNAKDFFLTSQEEILMKYAQIDKIVRKNMSKLFYEREIPEVKVQEIPKATKDSPPGIYNNNIFYYSFFGAKHSHRMMPFLYAHEAIPGHHYQIKINQALENQAKFKQFFFYGAYTEGWAAYCEDKKIGQVLGVYNSPYEYMGKLEWDLVRSVRVVLDIRLNYEGWSKKKALKFWKKYIPNQDDIAMREINRMLRWPAQVLTYKVGADRIFKLRKFFEEKEGISFDIKRFHQKVLEMGAVPLEVLESSLKGS